VAWNARILHGREQALDCHYVAMADAAGLDANAHFVRPRGRNVPLFRDEWSATLPNDHRTHFHHRRIPSIE
jgi:hypothetical protein